MTPADTAYWLLVGDTPAGPFPLADVHAKLASGEATWETRACPVGAGEWLPLRQMPGVGPATPDRPPSWDESAATCPARDTPPGGSLPVALLLPDEPLPASRPRPPWSPVAIAWLGLVFTPIWAGVMAAINNARVGRPRPTWLGPVIGIGCTALDLAADAAWDFPLWLHAIAYVLTVGALWVAVLRPQREAYARLPLDRPGGRWLWPAVAAAPLAGLAGLMFVVAPFIPDEPRQVCEKFARSDAPEEAMRYATLNLRPAVDELFRQAQTPGGELRFELADDGPAPADVGGHLVGYRMVLAQAGRPSQLEGVFHLVNWDGTWKVEDLYISAYNRQPIEPWASLAADYRLLAAADAPSPAKPGAGSKAGASGAARPAPARAWYTTRAFLKGAGVLGLALLGALARWATRDKK